MKLNEYQELAIRTAKRLETTAENLNHAALGIGSEAGELALTVAGAWMQLPFDPKNIPEEIGDACWYVALMCQTMDWRFEELFVTPEDGSDMSNELAAAVLGRNPIALTLMLNAFGGDILSVVKAHVIYGKPLDADLLKRELSLYVTTCSLLASIHEIPFEYVLDGNINKLAKRYPDKYSDQAALARADKAPSLVLVQ